MRLAQGPSPLPQIWADIDETLRPVFTALHRLPYKDAVGPLRSLQDVLDIISDPLGDPGMGKCQICEEQIFVRGLPDDDCTSFSEDGDYAHRSCMDDLQRRQPELFKNVDDDPDFAEVDDAP